MISRRIRGTSMKAMQVGAKRESLRWLVDSARACRARLWEVRFIFDLVPTRARDRDLDARADRIQDLDLRLGLLRHRRCPLRACMSGSLGTPVDVELVQDVVDVVLHGGELDGQPPRD